MDARFSNTLLRIEAEHLNRFEITGGGEPFLNRNLQSIILGLRSAFPSGYIKLYTNGHILRQLHGIDELNISVAHWEAAVNNTFFRLQAPRNVLSILRFFSPARTYKLRLSIPLIRGGIDNSAKLNELITQTAPYVDGYVCRPLFPFTPNRPQYDGEFHIEDPRVEVDAGACSHNDILLWMPDNRLYTAWNLAKELTDGSA